MSNKAFLDSDGVRYLWQKIKNLVQTNEVTKVPWDNVTNKPSLVETKDFTWDNIQSKPQVATQADLTWDNIQSKPSLVTEANFTWENLQAKPDVALKSDLTTVYRYKGTVALVTDLPTEGQVLGDTYNVSATDMNYAWDGTKWDPLGSSIQIESITNAEIDSIVTEAANALMGNIMGGGGDAS